MLNITDTEDAGKEGLLYVPNVPWLDLSGHELLAAIAAKRAELEERPSEGMRAELAGLEATLAGHVKVRILPMTKEQYKKARRLTKTLEERVSMSNLKGNFLTIKDQLDKETGFYLELIADRVTEVQELVVVKRDGTRTPITTGRELAEALEKKFSEEQGTALIEDIGKAIRSISHLEKGLGEALPSRSAS